MSEDLSPKDVVVVEVKPEEFLLDGSKAKEFRRKVKAAMRFCRNQGWRFKLITARHLRREPRLTGTWPRIYREAYSLAPPESLAMRLFRNGGQ